ncbi:hypothetical protein [Pedobacter nototheniae]|uniref:hypothetical protein n=1 Tax=Pedobacter nototheniae TaxID=2488994 RepID=UPI002931E226|nr:hypothetical protein [Pedobacter nototheniae]
MGLVLLLVPFFLWTTVLLFAVPMTTFGDNLFFIPAIVLFLSTLALPFFYAKARFLKLRTGLKIIKANQKTVISGKLKSMRGDNTRLVYKIEKETYTLRPFLGIGFYIQNYRAYMLDFCRNDEEIIISGLPEMELLFDVKYPKVAENKQTKQLLDDNDLSYLRKNTFSLFKPMLIMVCFEIGLMAVIYFAFGIFDLRYFLPVVILVPLPFCPNLFIFFKSFGATEKMVISGIVTEKFEIDIGYKNNDMIPRRYGIRVNERLFRCINALAYAGEIYNIAYVLNKDGTMGRMLM